MKRMSGEARRTQIVDAAHAVILEKGLAEAATRDVTRRLGVGSGLLHHYFKTWKSLRAEVVRVFITKEIEQLEQTLAAAAPDRLAAAVVDWMVQDPAFRHWRLWLDAIEEARRDPDLAEVVEAGYLRWQITLSTLVERIVAAGHGTCPQPQDAAWRISVLIDGLVGLLAFDRTPLTTEEVRRLLQTQLAMELSGAS
ncbi:TetR/AcrR family transcriptional regulator [Roseobacter sinensis]|uniref:TetR family transcriptional regulator C-terminal domain-containing protein n=1 Tax=Roseobacter sinensis TaxID=2931391 RepID=A0ABT3BJJ7_9RHOB|nr:TetR family transcriptional regulator C-terminal domain-containing protein [Roseobacter sp. WL0113]MCV3273752.1 TetR family transcriptional regulator C-terminal domain-containing protein [Roseobacter sp. WL0113]